MTFLWSKKQTLTVDFEGGEITSDAGLLLIRRAGKSLGLIERLAGCIVDRRDTRYADHDMETLPTAEGISDSGWI